MQSEPTEEFIRKLRMAEDLAYRLQKPDWRTRANRDKLEALIKEAVDSVRRSNVFARLKRLDALEKAQSEVEYIHDLGSRDSKQRLDSIFYLVRTARQGR
jgi:CHAT domain-containing protein